MSRSALVIQIQIDPAPTGGEVTVGGRLQRISLNTRLDGYSAYTAVDKLHFVYSSAGSMCRKSRGTALGARPQLCGHHVRLLCLALAEFPQK